MEQGREQPFSSPMPAVDSARRRRRASFLKTFSLLVAACALAFCLLVFVRTAATATRSLHPARERVVRPARTGSLASMRDVSFVTADHLTIRGWYIPTRNHAAVILSHGLGQNRTQMLFEAKILAERGFGVLLFDSRGQGESDGGLVTWGDKETEDLKAALGFVSAQPGVAADRIGALGCSMGGFALADLAATEPRFHAVALSAMNTSLEEVIRSDYHTWGRLSQEAALWGFRRGGVDVDAVRPIDAVSRIAPRSILFINGIHDPDSPVQAQDRLYRAAHTPKSRWDVDGPEYGNYSAVAPDAYRRQLLAFFEGNLLSVD